MKHVSRLLALLLAVALLPLAFAATASADEPVTISIWGSDRENMPFRNGLLTIDILQEKLQRKLRRRSRLLRVKRKSNLVKQN